LVIESDDPVTPVKFVEVLGIRFGMLAAKRIATIAARVVATSIRPAGRAILAATTTMTMTRIDDRLSALAMQGRRG
jgi:hypothetical protein